MSVLISYTVSGIPDPIKVHSEYTNPAVLAAWANSSDGFYTTVYDIFQKQKVLTRDANGNVISVTPSSIGINDAIDMIAAINDIKDTAVNGIVVGDKTYYLTYEMAQSLDKIIKSLKAVGFDFTADPQNPLDPKHTTNATALTYWVDLDDAGLREIIQVAGQAVGNSRSLQAMIELEYVRAGNELISEQLGQLDEALQATKAALAVLEKAQLLKNKLQPKSVPDSANDLTDAGGTRTVIQDLEGRIKLFTEQVTTQAGAHQSLSLYGSNLDPYKSGVLPEGAAATSPSVAFATFNEYFKSKFNHVFGTLLGVSVSTTDIADFNSVKTDLAKAIARLKALSGGTIEEGSAADALQKVLSDMSTGFPNWMLDGYNDQKFTKSGDFQRTLTEAITASESLNDKQKEDLRRFMFVFEQFYKSASAMLQGIDRIITKMAGGIKGA